jgi:hypothetical protein
LVYKINLHFRFLFSYIIAGNIEIYSIRGNETGIKMTVEKTNKIHKTINILFSECTEVTYFEVEKFQP